MLLGEDNLDGWGGGGGGGGEVRRYSEPNHHTMSPVCPSIHPSLPVLVLRKKDAG